MSTNRMTASQVFTLCAAVIDGQDRAEFLKAHADWPQADAAQVWDATAEEIRTTTLKPGQYWGVGSEWP